MHFNSSKCVLFEHWFPSERLLWFRSRYPFYGKERLWETSPFLVAQVYLKNRRGYTHSETLTLCSRAHVCMWHQERCWWGGHVHASAHECAGQREGAGQRAIPTIILSSSLPYSSEIGRSLPVQQQQLPGMPPASPTFASPTQVLHMAVPSFWVLITWAQIYVLAWLSRLPCATLDSWQVISPIIFPFLILYIRSSCF